jgi:ubiquinone/menaquinone biosynthesis C-methylase UbiE
LTARRTRERNPHAPTSEADMPETTTDAGQAQLRAMWMAGDFGEIARYGAAAAETLVAALPIPRGARVLDIACGTGNLAIPAARRGAVVTGVDIAANLVEQARARAAAEHLDATFDEGNAEALPYPDGRFDVVMALFGAMFASHAEQVAAEIARVCRPGGTMLMGNWTPDGFIGRMFALNATYLPRRHLAPAVRWGQEDVVRQRLGGAARSIEMARRTFPFAFPFGPDDVAELFARCFGPTIAILKRLDADRQDVYRRAFAALWREHNQAGDRATLVEAEYLEVVATRRADTH